MMPTKIDAAKPEFRSDGSDFAPTARGAGAATDSLLAAQDSNQCSECGKLFPSKNLLEVSLT